jgi:hypothetical protein
MGGDDSFLRKYDSDGVELWTRQFGTPRADAALHVITDRSGILYVVGETDGALADQTHWGGLDVYVRKYNSDGDELWTRQFGSPRNDSASHAVKDETGNLYVSGEVYGALPGQSDAGSTDGYIRKYNGDGDEVWTRQFGSSLEDKIDLFKLDRLGNLYVMWHTGDPNYGPFRSSLRKYDSNGNELWTDSPLTLQIKDAIGDGKGNLYVIGAADGGVSRKYNSDGDTLWTRPFEPRISDSSPSTIMIDTSGNLYVMSVRYTITGHYFSGDATYRTDTVVRKHDRDGNALWTRIFGNELLYGYVFLDRSDNLYVFNSLGGLAVRKYSQDGNVVWVREFSTPALFCVYDPRTQLMPNVAGDLYVVGGVNCALPGQTHMGYTDIYVAKIRLSLY